MISTHFQKWSGTDEAWIPENIEELNYVVGTPDLSMWDHGFLELRKQPIRLTANDRIVGIDPGNSIKYL
jgi:hypothetical protein